MVGDVYATVRHDLVFDPTSASIVFWRFLTSVLLCVVLAALIYVGDKAMETAFGRPGAK